MKKLWIFVIIVISIILLSCSLTGSPSDLEDSIADETLPVWTTEPNDERLPESQPEMTPLPTEPIEFTDQVPPDGAAAFSRSLPEGLFRTTWPEEVPADIPVLEGKITNVMGNDPSYIRIFYEPIPVKDIEAYVQYCVEQGFKITLVAYDVVGIPEDAEERLREGKYDAIEFRKGNYLMHLEHGEDLATLDIMIE